MAPLVAYVALASRSLLLPGIYYDEVLQAVPAIAAVRGGVHGPLIQVEGSVLHLAGHPFPLMILSYLGSVQAAALAVSFAVAGVSVATMRLTFIALGALGLVATYLFARRLFDGRTALLGVLLLAVDPTYIFATRSDNGPTAVMMICKMGALWLLARWWQGRRPASLLAGSFLLGLGLYDKVNFAWFIAALALGVVVVYPRAALAGLRRERWPVWAAAGAALCLGASALLAYTALSGGQAISGLLRASLGTTAFAVDNANPLGNLAVRIESLAGLLAGYELLDFYTTSFGGYHVPYSRGLWPTTALPWLAGLSLLASAAQATGRVKLGLDLRKAALLTLLTALIVLASAVTPTTLSYHHLLVAYPFPHLLVAHAVASVPRAARSWATGLAGRRLGLALASSLVVVALASSLGVVATYGRVLERTGGVGMWSDAIYQLAEYLERDGRTAVCADWGINLNLLMLSAGELRTEEVWQQFLYTRGDSPEMARLIAQPDRVFVFHAPRFAGVSAITPEDGPRVAFFRTVAARGAQATLETQISQRNGEPLFEVYAVSPSRAQSTEGEAAPGDAGAGRVREMPGA